MTERTVDEQREIDRHCAPLVLIAICKTLLRTVDEEATKEEAAA